MSVNGETPSSTAVDNSFWAIVREAFSGSERDLTTGSIGISLFILSIPMIIEMLAESLFAIVDVFYVAHLGANAVAVVGLTESLMFVIYSAAIGLSIGASASVARRIGEKDPDGAAQATTHALYIGLAVSVIFAVAGICLASPLLKMMHAEPDVIEQGVAFTQIMLGSNFVVVFLFLINSIFRGSGDAAIAMKVVWFANLLNIVLAPLFIFGIGPFPQLGVTGAAVGTSIGRGLGVLLAAYFLFFGKRRFTMAAQHWTIDLGHLWRLVKVSAPGVLQFFVQTASWIGIVRVIAGFGTDAVAGYQIGIRMIMFGLLPSVGLANAASTLVGQNLGAGDPERAEKAVWTAVRYNAVGMSLIGLAFVILDRWIVTTFFTTETIVVGFASDSLRIIAYGFLFYAIGMVLETAFNGAGDTWTPTILNFIIFWLFEIPFAYILAYPLGFGPHGAFWGITVSFSLMAVVAFFVFRRGRWKAKTI